LAAHASFDPNYDQAKQWIRARPIGSSTISPVLIQGLVGTLVDAAFPQTVPVESSIRYVRPLIVGTEVRASVVVVKVEEQHQPTLKPLSDFNEEAGFEIDLKTQVVRVQDDALIADGTHKVWIPNYLK
jgi:acyl dehydratase